MSVLRCIWVRKIELDTKLEHSRGCTWVEAKIGVGIFSYHLSCEANALMW